MAALPGQVALAWDRIVKLEQAQEKAARDLDSAHDFKNLQKQLDDLRRIVAARPVPPAVVRPRSYREFQHLTTDEEGNFRATPQTA